MRWNDLCTEITTVPPLQLFTFLRKPIVWGLFGHAVCNRSGNLKLLLFLICLYFPGTKAYSVEPTPMENWLLRQRIEGDGAIGNDGDTFGGSVAISGDLAIVGAPRDQDQGHAAGAAYIYQRQSTGSWIQTDKLYASDSLAGDFFGDSVSINGNTAIVGAWRSNSSTGSAYVFDFDQGGIGHEQAKLVAFDGAANDRFGDEVVIAQNKLVVGSTASAYVFKKDLSGSWSLDSKLVQPDNTTQSFGAAVAISDQRVIVGAWQDNEFGDEAGAAYVFEENGDGNWDFAAKLTAADASPESLFGITVAADVESIVIGAPSRFSTGAAYVFRENQLGDWVQVDQINPEGLNPGDGFGQGVSIDSDLMMIGASAKDELNLNSGGAFIYRDSESGWQQEAQIGAVDADLQRFGLSVAVDGGIVFAGAFPRSSFPLPPVNKSGAAYFYENVIPEPSSYYLFCTIMLCSLFLRQR